MRILMVTPEATPFAQTGGLGEVLSALPAELAALGLEVDVLLPKYRGINSNRYNIRKLDPKVEVTLNARAIPTSLWQLDDSRGCRYLFLECDDYYDREYLYGGPETDYEDNAERFVFLCRAAIEVSLARGIKYDIFHCHDWQASLTPVYLRTLYAGEPLLMDSASVMTIHNLGYQGIFWHLDMPLVGVGWEFFTPKHMEFHGKLNFLKSGIVFADKINTVSPGYRNEILTSDFGFGLEGLLKEKGDDLCGILNGVDYEIWNPAGGAYIAAAYSPDNLAGKARCKKELQERAGLPARADVPLIGMVSRLSTQKGIDLLEEAIPSLMEQELQLVLLGTGDIQYERSFRAIGAGYPGQAGIFLSYDYELAHQIFAGSDMLMVPSRYEPCGLNQLYALKYGTVPIVRCTGGLADTVEEYDAKSDSGTGFKFTEPSGAALVETVLRAVEVYCREPEAWKRLMIRGMTKDFSWKRSAREYLRIYEDGVARRRAVLEGAWKA